MVVVVPPGASVGVAVVKEHIVNIIETLHTR